MKVIFFILISLFCSFPCSAEVYPPFMVQNGNFSDFGEWISKQTGKSVIIPQEVNDRILNIHIRGLDSADLDIFLQRVASSNGLTLIDSDGVITFATSIEKSVLHQIAIDGGKPLEALADLAEQEEEKEPLNLKIYDFSFLPSIKAKSIFLSHLQSSIYPESSQINIAELPASNKLLVAAPTHAINSLDQFFPSVDVAEKQVLIEALIYESDANESQDLGFNFATALKDNGFSAVSKTHAALDLGANILFSSGGSIRSLVDCLKKNGSTKILSTPRILIMNQEQGYISVGQSVPFVLGSEISESGSTIQRIKREDIGVSLSVKPFILDDRIRLVIMQTSSSVTDSAIASDLITNQRKISTTIELSSGQSVLLGGLVSDETRNNIIGVPIIQDIPYLGRAFRHESEVTTQKELNIMIKAQII